MKIRSQVTLGLISCVIVASSFVSCTTNKSKEIEIAVKNNLDFNRKEIVTIKRNQLEKLLKNNSEKNIRVKVKATDQLLTTQWIDYDKDGKGDELLFQAEVQAKSVADFVVLIDTVKIPQSKAVAYSRFVPERIDDYAWENNKVAFRAYGPVAQQLVEEGKEGGTLSSGIDLWLKKVDYSIIDDWYAKNVKEAGYYHIDHGEGYDPYHVGASRGTGGSGVWVNDSLQVGKNYISYKIIANGPLRTIFELNYAPWSQYQINETKQISLDLDSNFSKFDITLKAKEHFPNYTIGITLHDKKGEVNINKTKGWFRHWEPIDKTFLGEGIVINPELVTKAFANNSTTPDQSNLLIVANPSQKITFYAGFVWTGSKQVNEVTQWDEMLNKQAQIIQSPLQVKVN
jgi:hypothetical protein